MNIKQAPAYLLKLSRNIDWNLLVFLVLFLNVKLIIKVAAIIFIFLFRFNFRFGFKLKNSRLPLFYLIVIAIAVLNWILYRSYKDTNYNIAFLTSICFWLASILAIHQVKWSVDHHDPAIIHRTILVFFILNSLASFLNLAAIIWETGAINPYLYQGNYQKYFIGTGDYIKGITFDTSTTNAVLNAFGIVYFLVRKQAAMLLLCMVIFLLTASNFANILLIAVFIYLFIFKSDRDQKSLIAACFMLLVVFLGKISPQNNQYVEDTYQHFLSRADTSVIVAVKNIPITERPDNTLNKEERKQKFAILYLDSLSKVIESERESSLIPVVFNSKPFIPKPNIHTKPFQKRNDTTALRMDLLAFAKENIRDLPMCADTAAGKKLPGKIIALQQTLKLFENSPQKIITGVGAGNFSSKLAFRTTGLKMAGGYPSKYRRINPYFLSNHLDLYLYFFSNHPKFHSLINNPASVYNQLLGEYGIAGILAFIFYYLGFFAKHRKLLTYGIPILFLLLGFFFIDYWFEQLSIVPFFELLLLVNIKENAN